MLIVQGETETTMKEEARGQKEATQGSGLPQGSQVAGGVSILDGIRCACRVRSP